MPSASRMPSSKRCHGRNGKHESAMCGFSGPSYDTQTEVAAFRTGQDRESRLYLDCDFVYKVMMLRLHIWIGNPQSVHDLGVLTDSLGKSVPLPRGNVKVICEAHEMTVH